MKRLTLGQLREVKIFNPHEFCQSHFWLEYTTYSRQTMGSAGWHLYVPRKPNPNPESRGQSSYRRWAFDARANGRSKPEEMRGALEPQLKALGFAWPERWIRFMASWMDADFFEKRMAELVARYKSEVTL